MKWKDWWERFRKTEKERQEEQERNEERLLIEEIEKAKEEWLQAQSRLDCVTDPELIDHAIFLIEAAEKKYMYLLRKARKQGIVKEIPMVNAIS
ncbi:hypothetical protein DNHGIG_15460 [Collibacillus ludicampi]|uniref:DUF2508 family protein n=1 Tax=Collibacillus ludicampi TaxID=2771369 RepID=A0AAV4LDS6_9BACL|nr:DUF2508 family protein [Collibacillus ludicampi]GIM45997.1 hypothetical protein DNHGIG_15460 [Collibacillus ludicampi]